MDAAPTPPDLELRAACIHGHWDPHAVVTDEGTDLEWQHAPCLGGRRVTIDYEAGADWWIDESRMLGYTTDRPTGRVKTRRFLAALGIDIE